MPYLQVTTPDARSLEVLTGGDPEGRTWLFHAGSPSAAVPHAAIDDAAAALGLRMVTWSRPGYGASTPRDLPSDGPRFVDDVADAVTILDHLGAEEFVTLGWSGGGPRALGCAALLPDRCRGAASLAGIAPRDAADLDWSAGMAPENVAEYAAAQAGATAYAAYLTAEFLPVLNAGPEDLVAGLGELLTPVDRRALAEDPGFAGYLAESFRRAAAQGVRGVRDDGLACVAPWGFDPTAIRVPVAVWQGRQDAMVPHAHGVWLAEHVPGAQAHLLDDEGHVSLVHRLPEILTDLVRISGWA